MADLHPRVEQLRLEAGVPSKPESDAHRDARLNTLQLESLGTARRHRISVDDTREKRRDAMSWKALDASRLSNLHGTLENQQSQMYRSKLSAWNNAWTILESDGTVEEDLQDINRGQTHRAKLTYEQNPCKNIDNRRLGVFHLKTHPNDGDLARCGNRNVRGGGSVVNRTRHIGPKRVPVGITGGGSYISHEPEARSVIHRTMSSHSGKPHPRSKITSSKGIETEPNKISASSATPATSVLRNPLTRQWKIQLASPEEFSAATSRVSVRRSLPSAGSKAADLTSRAISSSSPSVVPANGGALPETLSAEGLTSQPVVDNAADVVGGRGLMKDGSFYSEIDVAPIGIRIATPTPPTQPLVETADEPRSYSGDLLDFMISTEVSHAPRMFLDKAKDVKTDEEDYEASPKVALVHGKPSMQEILDHLNMYTSTLTNVLDPENMNSLEAIKTVLEEKIGIPPKLPLSADLLDSGQLQSTQEAIPTIVQDANTSAITNSDLNQMAQRSTFLDSQYPTHKDRERIVNKISMEEGAHFGPTKPRHSSSIIGSHLIPGHFQGRSLARSDSMASSGLSCSSVFSSATSPNRKALMKDALLPPIVEFGRLRLDDEGNATNNTTVCMARLESSPPFGADSKAENWQPQRTNIFGAAAYRTARKPLVPSLPIPAPTSQSCAAHPSVDGTEIQFPGFRTSHRAETQASNPWHRKEKKDKVREEKDKEGSPFSSIKKTVYVPTGPSRLHPLAAFTNHLSQQPGGNTSPSVARVS